MAWDLLAVGLTTLDAVARPIDALTHSERAVLIEALVCAPAGTAAGTALIAARLGLQVALAGAVGDDLNGDFVRGALARAGVDVRHVAVQAGVPTSSTLLTVETSGQRSAWHAPGAGSLATIDADLMAAVGGCRFLHYGGIGGIGTDGGPGADLLRMARAAGAVVTCDLVTPRPGAAGEVARLLPHVDWFLPSAAEARALTGCEDIAQAAERFVAMGARACVIKDGARGVHGLVAGRHFTVPAFMVEALDTTSCGDAFCAGFIAGLAQGRPVEAACRLGAIAAAQVARGPGTLGALRDLPTTLALMDNTPERTTA